MQAIEFSAPGTVRLVDRNDPDLPQGHVRLKVGAAGLCHTDLEILRGGYGEGGFPLVPGHEYAGTVVEIAPDVTDVAVGARVVVDPNLPCGTCRACRRGLGNLCPTLGAYGVTTDGGFATHSVVRADHVLPVGDMPLHRAALAEPLGCVLNGLRAAGAGAPECPVVFGAGPIGLMLALALRETGSGAVTVVDRDRGRLDLAERLGLAPLEADAARAPALAQSFDFAGDAAGATSVVQGLPGFLANGGVALVMGVCPREDEIAVRPYEFFRRQLRLAGSHSLAARDVAAARDMLARAGAAFDPLVSHRLPLDALVPFLDGGAAGPTMKVQFEADA